MTELLIKHIKKKPPEAQREAYGILSGFTGIVCNLLLCAVKFILGFITGAVSVTADAVNNLSDAAVNIVTIAGTKLAGKPVDKEHPFGHGRAEYISALVVALSVFLMSFELAKSSVIKIIHPKEIRFSAVYIVILFIAICVKLWMAYFNRKLYIITENLNLKAVMKDSLNDCIATLATAAVILFSGVFHIQRLDGIIGCAVAVFVFLSGVGVIKDILGPLLGQPPSDELVNEIEDIILRNELIWGVHDLIIHNYGPGRIIASAHAEVPCEADLMTVHEVIDSAEQEIRKRLNIEICIHTDPVAANDSEQEKYKILTEIILGEYNEGFTFHDLRLSERDGIKTLSFDLVIPFEDEGKKAEIEEDIAAIYKDKLPEIQLKMNIEHPFTS